MNKQILLPLFILLVFTCRSMAQDQHLIDSLASGLIDCKARKQELQLKNPSAYDTTETNILNALSKAMQRSNTQKAKDYAEEALLAGTRISYKPGMGSAWHNLGMISWLKGNYPQAMHDYQQAMKYREEAGDKKGIAETFLGIANVLVSQGDYPGAFKDCLSALGIYQSLGDQKGVAGTYNNLGSIYYRESNYKESIKNYSAALAINTRQGNKNWMAKNYNNIGLVYYDKGQFAEACQNFKTALKLYEETGDKLGMAYCYNNTGNTFKKQADYTNALKMFTSALKIEEELYDKDGIAGSNCNIGIVYMNQKQYRQATEYLNKSLQLSKEMGNLVRLEDSYDALAIMDSVQGNYKQALIDYKLSVIYRDSLDNEENIQKVTQQQMQFDFDKKQVADSLRFLQEKELDTLRLQKQKVFTYGGFTGVAITVILLFLVYSNYRRQRLANRQLKETQEQLIQSEKMAAFGMMASRMSHEIQNPLNFVNNFSEISRELVQDVLTSESKEEIRQHASLLDDNLQKIHEHGQRASAIIHQLQEHTRKGSAHEFFEEKKENAY